MNSLAYLTLRSVKNRFLELLRSPGKLIMYLLVIALIVLVIIGSMFTRNHQESFSELFWLKGIVFAFLLIFFILSVLEGLRSGVDIFDMNDVNLLFVSPLSPHGILLYGVVRMMGMTFLGGFFILFQGGTLGTQFGIYFDGILLILAAFILAVSFMKVLTLLIYIVTNGNEKRKMAVRMITIAIFIPAAVAGIYQFIQTNGNITETAEYLLHSPVTSWIPAVGWASEGVFAFLSGNIISGCFYFGLIIAVGILLIKCILSSNPDYYEDVLVASEMAFERKRAIAEGRIDSATTRGKKIQVVSSGIKGKGASVIFYKHLREAFRSNRLGLWGASSFFIIAAVAVYAFFFSRSDFGQGFLVIVGTFMWMQVFLIGTGRGMRELYNHYIYMIPESSFSKIIWSNLETIFKILIESLFAFGIAGIILRASPLMTVTAVLLYTLFSLLLIGLNYLSMRWVSADISAGILVVIYIFSVIIVMAPGLIPAVIVGIQAGDLGIPAGMAVLAVWELLAALGCFALSKGILHSCDIQVMRTK